MSRFAWMSVLAWLAAGCGAASPGDTAASGAARSPLELCRAGVSEGCYSVLYPEQVEPDPAPALEALELLRAQCTGGDAVACTMLGWALTDGAGRWPDDEPGALEALDRGCALEHGMACLWAGMLVGPRPDLPGGDVALAVEYHARGCALGEGSACVAAGDLIVSGALPERGALEGVALYRDGCARLAHGESCHAAGQVLELGLAGGVEADAAAAIEAYQAGCAAGHGASCADAALLWHESGAVLSGADALELTMRGCVALADPASCEARGLLLVLTAAERDDAQALADGVALLELACNEQRAPACMMLGQIHAGELGSVAGAVSPERAMLQFRTACEVLGFAPACGRLAGYVAFPQDGEANLEQGRRLAASACEAQDGYGCAMLGRILEALDDASGAAAARAEGCRLGHAAACSD